MCITNSDSLMLKLFHKNIVSEFFKHFFHFPEIPITIVNIGQMFRQGLGFRTT